MDNGSANSHISSGAKHPKRSRISAPPPRSTRRLRARPGQARGALSWCWTGSFALATRDAGLRSSLRLASLLSQARPRRLPPLGGMIMSFDPTFARTVMLPFVRAAYAVTADPTHEPQLPAGFTKTALLEADMDLVAELLKDLGDTAAPLRAMTAVGTIYGL